MSYHTFLMVMAFGIVTAGVVHSGWLWLGRERPSFWCLIDGSRRWTVPFTVVGLMSAAPLILAGNSVRALERGRHWGWLAGGLLLLAAIWCFMLGIVVVVLLHFLAA